MAMKTKTVRMDGSELEVLAAIDLREAEGWCLRRMTPKSWLTESEIQGVASVTVTGWWVTFEKDLK